jgi:hypothetical protein
MENIDFNKYLGRALIALVVGALIASLVKSRAEVSTS